jgi:hypothetical protein
VDEQAHREELKEGCCASCREKLAKEEASLPVCRRCDERLGRELAAYLSFVAVARE